MFVNSRYRRCPRESSPCLATQVVIGGKQRCDSVEAGSKLRRMPNREEQAKAVFRDPPQSPDQFPRKTLVSPWLA